MSAIWSTPPWLTWGLPGEEKSRAQKNSAHLETPLLEQIPQKLRQ